MMLGIQLNLIPSKSIKIRKNFQRTHKKKIQVTRRNPEESVRTVNNGREEQLSHCRVRLTERRCRVDAFPWQRPNNVPVAEAQRADDDASSQIAFFQEQRADKEATAALRLQHADEHPFAVCFRCAGSTRIIADCCSQVGGIP